MPKFSPIVAAGGKSNQAEWILSHLPPHQCWVEVFAFSAILTFTKRPSYIECINDINEDLIRFYRFYQHNGIDFIRKRLRYGLYSRATFKMYQAIIKDTNASEEERAFAFWYCNRNSINSMGLAWSYGITTKQSAHVATREDFETLESRLEAAYKRLDGVQIECLPYQEIIDRYGKSPDTLLYCDPPYYVATGNHGYYANTFGAEDHLKLKELLVSASAKWLLSYDDLPQVREMYKDYEFKVWEYIPTMNTSLGDRKVKRELLIANFPMDSLESLPLFGGINGESRTNETAERPAG